jgi:ribonuclease Z
METTNNHTELIMLGTGNAAVTHCYNTCFAMSHGGHVLLVDAGGGNGILVQLEKSGISIGQIHEMFVTHAHTDHVLGVIWIIRTIAQRMQQGVYQGTFKVYTHDKVIQVVDWICRMTLPKKIVAFLGNGIELCEVKDGECFDAADFKLQCFDINSTKEKQFGFLAVLPDGRSLSVWEMNLIMNRTGVMWKGPIGFCRKPSVYMLTEIVSSLMKSTIVLRLTPDVWLQR